MAIKKVIALIGIVPFLAGCAKLAHLQELLTLKAYSDGQDEIHQYVEQQDENFKKLLHVVKDDRLNQYDDKTSISKEFGEPVLSREVVLEGKSYDRWLYRYSTKYFKSEKVYIYFDHEGKLQNWEHIVPTNKENGEDA